MKSKLCGFREKKCEGRAVSRERGPGTGGPAREGEPAWSGSRTEVCGAARRARRGEEMTSQKGVVTAPARAPEPSPVEGRRGGQSWEGGRTRRLPGPGKPRGRDGPAPPSRRTSGPRGRDAESSPGPPAEPGGRRTDTAPGGPGDASPAGGRFPSRGPERGERKDGLQCEAGTARRKRPSRAHLGGGTFMTGRPATPEPEPREPQPQGRGRPDASPAGTGTLQAPGPRGACPPGPHPRAGLPSEGLGRECPAALAGSGPGPPAAPLG